MSEDLKPGSKLDPTVVDPHNAPVQFVDWIVTSGIGPAPGLINIDLAALDYALAEPGMQPQAIVQSRLRMSTATAADLFNTLKQILEALAPAKPDEPLN